jgi:hypothetical protein
MLCSQNCSTLSRCLQSCIETTETDEQGTTTGVRRGAKILRVVKILRILKIVRILKAFKVVEWVPARSICCVYMPTWY